MAGPTLPMIRPDCQIKPSVSSMVRYAICIVRPEHSGLNARPCSAHGRRRRPLEQSRIRRRGGSLQGADPERTRPVRGWVAANGFCPNCGATPLTAFAANAPLADFHCRVCAEEYELKATKGRTATKLVNGAWGAMKARLAAANNPSLMVIGQERGMRQGAHPRHRPATCAGTISAACVRDRVARSRAAGSPGHAARAGG